MSDITRRHCLKTWRKPEMWLDCHLHTMRAPIVLPPRFFAMRVFLWWVFLLMLSFAPLNMGQLTALSTVIFCFLYWRKVDKPHSYLLLSCGSRRNEVEIACNILGTVPGFFRFHVLFLLQSFWNSLDFKDIILWVIALHLLPSQSLFRARGRERSCLGFPLSTEVT